MLSGTKGVIRCAQRPLGIIFLVLVSVIKDDSSLTDLVTHNGNWPSLNLISLCISRPISCFKCDEIIISFIWSSELSYMDLELENLARCWDILVCIVTTISRGNRQTNIHPSPDAETRRSQSLLNLKPVTNSEWPHIEAIHSPE